MAPRLFLLICEALGKKADYYLDFAIIPEVVHNGTLVIDDIEDSSELRRGKPCTYKIFGMDIAVNAGNAMYYLPLLPLMEKRTKLSAETLRDIYEVYVQEMINLSMGQAMDIAWHRGIANADDLSEEDYLQMCAYKTGTLARMAARMAAVLAGADTELVEKLGRFRRKHRRRVPDAGRHFGFDGERVRQEERRRRTRHHRGQTNTNGYSHA